MVALPMPSVDVAHIPLTEVLLAAAALLDDLDQAGLELLNGRHVVGQHAHLAGLRRQVDLDDVLGLVDGLVGRRRNVSFEQLDMQSACRDPGLPHPRAPAGLAASVLSLGRSLGRARFSGVPARERVWLRTW